jgi:quercetin dioxygenase-like cupin family protein
MPDQRWRHRARSGRPLLAAVVLAAALAAMLGACQATGAGPTPSPSGGIIRQDLGNVLPATAQGERLGLWHYTIPAGSALVPHHHPGWQVARIAAGTLTYQILKGEATVIRGSGATETHKTGETITLATGDSIVENPDLDHFGSNSGSTPVEIYAASLFTDGQPPAIPLASPSTAP